MVPAAATHKLCDTTCFVCMYHKARKGFAWGKSTNVLSKNNLDLEDVNKSGLDVIQLPGIFSFFFVINFPTILFFAISLVVSSNMCPISFCPDLLCSAVGLYSPAFSLFHSIYSNSNKFFPKLAIMQVQSKLVCVNYWYLKVVLSLPRSK